MTGETPAGGAGETTAGETTAGETTAGETTAGETTGGDARLADGYRRWLRVYPRAYRRERGEEIVATLLDAAGPDRTRPAAREVAHLVRYGLGRRIAGYGRRAFVVAVFAAVLGGLGGIALGSWLSWRDVDPMAPDRASVSAVANAVLPGPVEDRIGWYGRSTFWNPYSENSLHGGTGVRAGRATASGTMPAGAGFEQVAATVEQRMRAQGWHDVRTTVERYDDWATAEVTGTRDGRLAAVEVTSGDSANPAEVNLALMWAEPPGQVRDAVLGGVAGALFGALLGLATAKRMRSHSARRQRAYSRLCVATLLMLGPACLANIPTATGSLLSNTHRNGTGPRVWWGGFVIWGAEPLAILSVLPVVAIVLACLWPRPEPARTPTVA